MNVRTRSGAEGRIHSGRHVCPIQAPADNVVLGGGFAGEACLTRAITPVELDLLQVEKVH